MNNQKIQFVVKNICTGEVTVTSAVSPQKAANNVRWVNNELYFKVSDYEVRPK